jgi:hypothetical protein
VANTKERWKDDPDPHDYPAAADYLTLLFDENRVTALIEGLKAAPVEHRLAKDLLRSSRLALLSADNFHVARDLAKVRKGERLSPVLLVRGNFAGDVPLTVADGYHRICASYHVDEDEPIPCRIANFPAG